MHTEHLRIMGMTCGGCTTKITRALKSMPGVGGVSVSLTTEIATIQYDDKLTSADQLKQAITAVGYGVGSSALPIKAEGKGGCCG